MIEMEKETKNDLRGMISVRNDRKEQIARRKSKRPLSFANGNMQFGSR